MKLTTYTFHRENGWYPLELKSDDEARSNARRNAGTTKVVNEETGEVVWQRTRIDARIRANGRPIEL